MFHNYSCSGCTGTEADTEQLKKADALQALCDFLGSEWPSRTRSCEFGSAQLYSSTHGAVAQLVERLLCK